MLVFVSGPKENGSLTDQEECASHETSLRGMKLTFPDLLYNKLMQFKTLLIPVLNVNVIRRVTTVIRPKKWSFATVVILVMERAFDFWLNFVQIKCQNHFIQQIRSNQRNYLVTLNEQFQRRVMTKTKYFSLMREGHQMFPRFWAERISSWNFSWVHDISQWYYNSIFLPYRSINEDKFRRI